LFTLGLELTTPYSLGILVWNFYQTFFTVSTECWLIFEPEIPPTRLTINFYKSLPVLKGRFVCVWNCLIVFMGEYSSVWPEICLVLSQWRFLRGISGKNYFGRIFQKFCANQDYALPTLVKFCPTLWNYILGPWSTSIKKSQKEDTGKKSQDVFFSENQFCSPSV